MLPLLTKIINLSLTEGLFAEEWKAAIIHPLLKKPGLDVICRNYRPVSNLPFLSKVVEKTALKQFIKHCNENSFLPTYQSAYRKNYSCKTALVKLFDDLLWSMEKQKVNLLVAIDLSVAFDMVDHGFLIDVLNIAFNVGGKSLDWFKSYLYPRSCRINIGDSFSSSQDLGFLVLQGSLCGPVLYNAYASTMKTIVPPDMAIHTYADDHVLKKEFNSSVPQDEVVAAESLGRCPDKVRSWMNSCFLKMNTDKTEAIIYESRQQIKKCRLTAIEVCGDSIPYSESIKYLGVCINSNHCLDNHIAAKCRIAMYNLFKIANIRNFLTPEACHTAALAMGLCQCHNSRTPRKAYRKATESSEYGCKGCVEKRKIHQFKS